MILSGAVPQPYPNVPGLEGSGTVVETGSDENAKAMAGKRVSFTKSFIGGTSSVGSWGQFMVTSWRDAMELPDDVTLEEGASHYVNPCSAYRMVQRAQELGAKTIIVTAAASQLGRMVYRLAERENLTVIGTVRKAAQVDLLKEEVNAKYVVNTSEENWKETMTALAKDLKPHVCLECIGGAFTQEIMQFMGPGSTTILYGSMDRNPFVLPAGFMIMAATSVEGFILAQSLAKLSPEEYKKFSEEVRGLLKTIFKTTVVAKFGIHQVKEAIASYTSNMSAGKVLL